MATKTRQSKAVAAAKSRMKSKAGRQAAIATAVKPQPAKATKAKPEPAKAKFVRPTKEEAEASDTKFYSTLEANGVVIENPKTNQRLSRGILQAHCMAEVWGKSPLTPEQVVTIVEKRFGIKLTVARVEKHAEYEVLKGRLAKKGKGHISTGKTANYHSLAAAE